MNEKVEAHEGEVLDSMLVASQQHTALAHTDNPYLAMAQLAMTQGKIPEMRELMAMHKEWDQHQAFKAYVAAMAAFKAEPMEILKRKLVEFQTRDGDTTSYRHAELSDVTDAVVPAMGRHGLSHRWDVSQEGGSITVTCTVTHSLGHSESVKMTAQPDASGKKNAIQQVASTITYLQRYTLLAMTGMATKGMDDDARSAYEETALPAKDQAWIDAVSALTDYPEYLDMKKKMLADYGGKPDNIPVAVRDTFNRIAAMTKPKD